MKKLLTIAPAYSPLLGGVEEHLSSVNNILRNRYKITVLVRHSDALPNRQVIDGIKVVRLPKITSIWVLLPWMLVNLRLFINVYAVHSHDFYPYTVYRLLKRKRWVHTFHGYEGYPISSSAIKGRRKIRKEIKYCISVGSFIEKWYGTNCDAVIYGGIDTNRFKNNSVQIKYDYIYYGRLDIDTGFVDYLKGFREINNKHPETSMVVLGGGIKEDWAREYVKKYSLNVDLLGWQKPIDNYLLSSRVAFVSGYLGILESGLAKKPIIAYYGTPIKKDYLEMHPMAKNFSIVNSVDDIVRAGLKYIVQKPDKIDKMYEWSSKQSWQSIADLYESYYEKGRH